MQESNPNLSSENYREIYFVRVHMIVLLMMYLSYVFSTGVLLLTELQNFITNDSYDEEMQQIMTDRQHEVWRLDVDEESF